MVVLSSEIRSERKYYFSKMSRNVVVDYGYLSTLCKIKHLKSRFIYNILNRVITRKSNYRKYFVLTQIILLVITVFLRNTFYFFLLLGANGEKKN